MELNNDQQVSTLRWKKQARDYYEQLDEIHQYIVDLKLDNLAYIVIQQKVKERYKREFKEQSLRAMFIESGTCYEAYVYLEKQRIIERRKEKEKRIETMDQGVIKALQLLEQAMYDGSISENQIKAAESYLDRAGVPKKTKVEQSGSVDNPSLIPIAEGIKAILENRTK